MKILPVSGSVFGLKPLTGVAIGFLTYSLSSSFDFFRNLVMASFEEDRPNNYSGNLKVSPRFKANLRSPSLKSAGFVPFLGLPAASPQKKLWDLSSLTDDSLFSKNFHISKAGLRYLSFSVAAKRVIGTVRDLWML